MADNVEVKIVGDTGDAKSSIQDAQSSISDSLAKIGKALEGMGEKSKKTHDDVKTHTAGIASAFAGLHENIRVRFGSINSVFEQFSSKLAIFGAAFAGGALFKGAIESMIHLRDTVHGLQQVFGTTAEQATLMAVQLKIAGVSAGDFEQMAFRVGRMLKTQSEEFDRLKVKTRDATGAFLPMDQILQNVYKRMLDFKAGTDQDMFAMATAGRNAKDFAGDMEALNAATLRATQFQQKFGIEMGPDRQAEIAHYKMSLNETKLVFEEIGVRVGMTVLPRLEGLSAWFMDVGPRAIAIIVDAVKVFVTVLEFLGGLLAAVAIKATSGFKEIAISAKANAAIVMAVFTHDWAAIPAIIAQANADIVKNNATSAESITEIWAKAANKVKALWADVAAITGSASGRTAEDRGAGASRGKGTESFTVKPKGGGADERLAAWKDELLKLQEAEGYFHEFSKTQEAEFWEAKLAIVKGKGKEDVKLRQELNHMIFADKKAAANEELQLELAKYQRMIDAAKNQKDKQLSLAHERTELARATFGEESKQFESELDKEIKLREAWAAKDLAILEIHERKAEAVVQHDLAMRKINLDEQLALGTINKEKALAIERSFLDQEYSDLIAQKERKLALLKGDPTTDPVALARMEEELLHIRQDYETKATELTKAAVLERERYALEADKVVESSFSTLLSDLANRTKTLKQSFLDFFKSLTDGLNKIAANKLAEELFGAGSKGGGIISGLTSKIFGGGALGAAGKSADTTAEAAHTTAVSADTTAIATGTATTTALNTVSLTLQTSLAALVASANAAAAALASVGSSGAGGGLLGAGGGGLGGLFGEGGILNFDVGTPYVPQDSLAYVHRGEAIIPAKYNSIGSRSVAGGMMSVHNHFVISGPIDTRTQEQIADSTANAVRRAASIRNR